MIHLVLLSGGSGTRLWPLSNSSRSKQFLKVLRDAEGNHVSMVQRVFGQIRSGDADVDVTIATCAAQENSIRRQVEGGYALVLEPERRDTAPAIMLACANLAYEQKTNEGDTVIVMPIDTYADQAYYDGIVKLDEAVQSGFAELVLLGVEPTYPSEKYGYIVPETPEGDLRKVARFTEKPNEATARGLLAKGALWNGGVFAFKLGYLTDVAAKYLPVNDFEQFRDRYSELPKISFDYEVVEKASSVAVVPYSGEWKDLGTWNPDRRDGRRDGRPRGGGRRYLRKRARDQRDRIPHGGCRHEGRCRCGNARWHPGVEQGSLGWHQGTGITGGREPPDVRATPLG